MTSNKPYLIRALYEWILDNNMTPHLLVNAESEHVQVPEQYIHEDRIVLNINPSAVHQLQLGNEAIEFSARFSGVAHSVYVPATAVMAIYARENGQGMAFANNDANEPEPANNTKARLSATDTGKAKPKDNNDHDDDPSKPPPNAPKPGKKPALKIVK